MSRGKGHLPVRTCVSCGAKRTKKELFRFVLDPHGQWVSDDSGRRSGRGVYACKASACIEKLMRRKRPETTFRVPRKAGCQVG